MDNQLFLAGVYKAAFVLSTVYFGKLTTQKEPK
jgi:hypothetical protein